MSWEHELNHEKAAPKPVTLPVLKLADIEPETEAEAAQAAKRAAMTRTIRQGRDANRAPRSGDC